jgi:hypothetical protein
MTEQDDKSTWKSSTNGDSAWKEARERVATRNEATRKSGKQEREAYERSRESVRKDSRAAAPRQAARPPPHAVVGRGAGGPTRRRVRR